MSDFENYIRQPEMVDEKMVALPPYAVEPFRRINDEGWLEQVVDLEAQLMGQQQSRLFNVGSVIVGHLWERSLEGLSDKETLSKESLANFTQINNYLWTGFTIGNMAAQGRYFKFASIEAMYMDVSPTTLSAFEDREPIEVEMLLDTIDVNTTEQTESLRELTSYWLEVEADREDLRQAATIGAVVSYSLMIYERQARRELHLEGLWEKYENQKTRTQILIASLPHRVRELKAENKF